MFSGKLAESITILRTSQQKNHLHCELKRSDLSIKFLRTLQRNRYIYGFRKLDSRLIVYLRYYRGIPIIKKIKPGSTPGSRQYINKKTSGSLKKDFLALSIISTSKFGLVSNFDAQASNQPYICGELICTVW